MQTIAILAKVHNTPLLALSAHSLLEHIQHPSFLAHYAITVEVDAPETVVLATDVAVLLPADIPAGNDSFTADPAAGVTVTFSRTLPTHAPESRGLPVGPTGHTHPAVLVTVTAGDGASYPVHVLAHLHPMAGKHADGTTGSPISVEME